MSKQKLSAILIFLVFSSFCFNSILNCDIHNPVYVSIISKDISKVFSNLGETFDETPFVTLDNGTKFYLDSIKNTCYFKFKSISSIDPKVYLYYYFSDISVYKRSFDENNNELADGYILNIRGTKDPFDIVQDIQAFLKQTPGYFTDILHMVDESLKQNSNFLNRLHLIVGHSLGGFLAELLAVYYDKKAISIDSPATTDFIKNIQKSYNIPQEKVNRIINEKITSYISLPNIINSYFHYDRPMNVIFSDPNPNCNDYYYSSFDISKISFKYLPRKISDMTYDLLSWSLYYHRVTTMRDSLIANFKGNGYNEIIGNFDSSKINLKYYFRSPLFERFFKKFYDCLRPDIESVQTYKEFVEERIKEYENDEKRYNKLFNNSKMGEDNQVDNLRFLE